jgi:hypothetical protein
MLQDSSNLCTLECFFIQKFMVLCRTLFYMCIPIEFVDICLSLLKINIIEFVILSV